jgi:hypothetical protein
MPPGITYFIIFDLFPSKLRITRGSSYDVERIKRYTSSSSKPKVRGVQKIFP